MQFLQFCVQLPSNKTRTNHVKRNISLSFMGHVWRALSWEEAQRCAYLAFPPYIRGSSRNFCVFQPLVRHRIANQVLRTLRSGFAGPKRVICMRIYVPGGCERRRIWPVGERAILVGLAAIRFGVSRFLSLARLLPGSDLPADRAAALGIMHGAE
jgi:hypothetical protein